MNIQPSNISNNDNTSIKDKCLLGIGIGISFMLGVLFIASHFYQPLYKIVVFGAIIEVVVIVGFILFLAIYAPIRAKRNI